ncbi:MAG TPA: hypothetical protein VKE51_06420 [Vicinamibacterales bacterium]|nr:hypothetical protein [Vicinamibacterales bacterium]
MTHILAAALVLQLHNLAGAPTSAVGSAASELTRLYADIGVRLEWRDATTPGGADMIHVILLPNETGDLRRAADTVMGAAVSINDRTHVAYIFYRRLRAEADRYATSTIQALACAMAHEIGHLLMPHVQHSTEGLMRARWYRDDFSRADQGQLRFTREQVALIQAAANADGVGVRGSAFEVRRSGSGF